MNTAVDNRSAGPAVAEPADLRAAQMVWLAAALFVVSAGYGALMPLLPGWLTPMMPDGIGPEIGRHVGYVSGVYAGGVLLGAPLWGLVSDRVGRGRILLIGLVGYVVSLLALLVPGWTDLWVIYALRGINGFFVAAVVPVVAALVAEHTPEARRARRFAWLGAMSLLGFLFGPGLNIVADSIASWFSDGTVTATLSTQVVLVLSALLGGLMMLGLAWTLPPNSLPGAAGGGPDVSPPRGRFALWGFTGALMFVLTGFELGIVLQGQQVSTASTRQAAIMFAECSLVMLGVNAVLFATALLEKIAARVLIGSGLVLAIGGLIVMMMAPANGWMYLGVSLTSAGTGLILPVIAYLAAGVSAKTLGATMGGLAAASGFGQTIGSAAGGWLFGALAQATFGWLTLPLLVMLGFLIARPAWGSAAATVTPALSSGPSSQAIALANLHRDPT